MKKTKSKSRVSTGITGVDSMIDGGLPHGSVVGLSGPAGVGKSIFAMHFLLEGAKNGEKCVYICLEEPRENIDRNLSNLKFGSQILEFEKKGKIKILNFSYNDYEKIHKDLFHKIAEDNKVTRLVVDSFNGFFTYTTGVASSESTEQNILLRKMISNSFDLFRKQGLTTLLTLENDTEFPNYFNHIVSFMVDGEINLDFLSFGSIERRIFVKKMRWTKQYDSSLPFEIGKNGISVKKEE
ncbi:MAG: AAA family ATPase [Nanoarchaeota archaeon]|nr:AAA family ATPase [Nanoarchaeota archaeon]